MGGSLTKRVTKIFRRTQRIPKNSTIVTQTCENDTVDTAATTAAALNPKLNRQLPPPATTHTSHIQFSSKFYERVASQFTPPIPIPATVPTTVPSKEVESIFRLRWHFATNLFLEAMQRGDVLANLESMDESAVKAYLGSKFDQVQFNAAKNESGFVCSEQICKYVPASDDDRPQRNLISQYAVHV